MKDVTTVTEDEDGIIFESFEAYSAFKLALAMQAAAVHQLKAPLTFQ